MPADAKSPKKLRHTRAALTHKTGYALHHPDHVGYYRAVMASGTRSNLEAAVGSQTHDRWLALGQMQFDHLVEHGLRPEHRMLDIGRGNLRGGWHFIGHLRIGNYYGFEDWEQRPHGPSKIRVSRTPLPTVC